MMYNKWPKHISEKAIDYMRISDTCWFDSNKTSPERYIVSPPVLCRLSMSADASGSDAESSLLTLGDFAGSVTAGAAVTTMRVSWAVGDTTGKSVSSRHILCLIDSQNQFCDTTFKPQVVAAANLRPRVQTLSNESTLS